MLEGEARFTVGDEQILASAGDTLTGPAGIWHGFKNCGTGRLRVIGIHASDTIIQENNGLSFGVPRVAHALAPPLAATCFARARARPAC